MTTRRPAAPLAAIATAVRAERRRSGLSLTELAARAGVAKSTLSQLESGSGNPSVETLWALAVALGVPFSHLVEPTPPRVRVVRAGEGTTLESEQANFAGTLLATCPPGARRDIFVARVEPGGIRHAEPHIPGSLEHVVVMTGRLRTGPAGGPVDLEPGDYAVFPGDRPHVYQALAPATSAVVIMENA